ncbi:hypothetical protein EON66_01175 [archaeon]|nr:MAG: hypothetical protein EON66_01175 [archaeon]
MGCTSSSAASGSEPRPSNRHTKSPYGGGTVGGDLSSSAGRSAQEMAAERALQRASKSSSSSGAQDARRAELVGRLRARMGDSAPLGLATMSLRDLEALYAGTPRA